MAPRRVRCGSNVSMDEAADGGADVNININSKYFQEKAVLKYVPQEMDSDDWPIFLLEDATVFLKDGRTIGNLLHAELQGPFTVRGKLVVEKEDRLLCKCRMLGGSAIEEYMLTLTVRSDRQEI